MFTARMRKAAIAGAVLIGVGLALSGATVAQAAAGGSLPPGSTVCTERIRSTQGVAFYGSLQAPVTGVTALWTVYASATEAGPETTLVRLPSREPSTTYLSWPGTFYYRLCVTNTATAIGLLRFNFFGQGTGAVGGFGPATAVLGPAGSYCGLETSVPARLAGTSTAPVRWTAEVGNFNAEFLRTEQYGTSTGIDRPLTPGDDEIFQVCVANPSNSTATISFDLTRP
ncbi:hypothetical protein [Plantactinospora sp. KLBMP9567]|uniref:hypothetical protein n=1 Tax=Plantactinospora sp. KLBMP9567 TaxID=3085900 RepID=UPI0029817186|nr:hypothetical protein [Plantactinospora sp. KLBMP9567]MDW5326172.1 hypothetical protein [Plantactinospora sp. KLBMP9567]